MGATTFSHYSVGTTVQEAFSAAHDAATHEYGHGGYSGTISEKTSYNVISNTPLLMIEAEVLCDKLLDANDPRVCDKWGPAGAIPVVKDTREVGVGGFTYTPTAGHPKYNEVDPALLEVVAPLVKLGKGEAISRVDITSSTQPQVSNYGGFARTPSRTKMDCQARVTIQKAPVTRVAPIAIEIPGGLDYDQRNKEIQKQVDTMKVKAGEKVISWRQGEDTPGPAKVTAVAPKGATETRYVITDQNGREARGVGHATWEQGFTSQADARAWLTSICNNEKNWVDNGPLRWLGDDVTLEVQSVTRRAGGEPLVRVSRQVGKRLVSVDVTVKLANAKVDQQPDGWLFFGWASC